LLVQKFGGVCDILPLSHLTASTIIKNVTDEKVMRETMV
jgi:hypothetical protein